jgi:hypothetical protein
MKISDSNILLAVFSHHMLRLVRQFESLERAVSQSDSRTLSYRMGKLCAPVLLCGVAQIAIISLWRLPYVLAGVLVALALVKHKWFPIRFEWFWFFGVAFLGAYAEAGIVASGGWSYPDPQFAGIPIWLPSIWGLTGISLMTAYAALTESFTSTPKLSIKDETRE